MLLFGEYSTSIYGKPEEVEYIRLLQNFVKFLDLFGIPFGPDISKTDELNTCGF